MRSLVLAAVAVLTVACGAADPGEPAEQADATTPPDITSPVPGTTRQVTGTLGGDPTLEGGCVWLETGAGRVEIVWPEGYEASADPVQLVGPDGAVTAEEGDEVTVLGREDPDRMSVCQVGPIWSAESVAAD